MSDLFTQLSRWFSDRPKWLQVAATRLLEQMEFSNADVSELATLCQQEIEGKLAITTCSFPASAFSQGVTGSIRLSSISDVEGVNALAPRKPLEFGKSNITVVYGHNGSGKSSYVRLLKHVCGARHSGTLHSDVFKPSSEIQKACIAFEQNGIGKTHAWSGQGVCSDLSSVDIFDTSFGRVFISSEDEVSCEPPVLSFFSSLITVCEKVSSALDAEISLHQSRKPKIPPDKKITSEGIWYDSINVKTTRQEINKYCSFEHTDEVEIRSFQKRLAEQAPAEKAKQLATQKQHTDNLVRDAQKYLKQLSSDNCLKIIASKKKALLKKSAADIAAKKVFSGSHLEGIGSDIWKELWEAARNYSISSAYKELDYPNVSEDSRCILCHQNLAQEAKDRLASFDSFVNGEMQRAATEAMSEYEALSQAIEKIPASESLKTRVDAMGIQQDEFTGQVLDFFTQLQARKDQLLNIDSDLDIHEYLQSPKWIDEANRHSENLAEQVAKYQEDARSDNRDEIKKKLNSLLTKQWLSEHRDAIEEEINHLILLGQLQEAKKTTNTKALSQKKGELAEILITDAFVQRFNTELKALGALQIKVELVKSKVSKGRVLHRLQLRDAAQGALADVLSEGENRIVSIASFLADVTGKSQQTPFIFDDPISSLDQSYEEAVVKRLIDLSNDKQIIIFTHRLSLLGTIRHFADKKSIKPEIVGIRSTGWGAGEPAQIPLSQHDIKSALNILIDRRVKDAKKASDNGDFEHAEILLKSICSEFRILVERSIENDLLCGVVQRFNRPISTSKIKQLAKLNKSDCGLLDSLMTKYSGFEHSQSEESPIQLPTSDELLVDLSSLKEWREEYAKRRA